MWKEGPLHVDVEKNLTSLQMTLTRGPGFDFISCIVNGLGDFVTYVSLPPQVFVPL